MAKVELMEQFEPLLSSNARFFILTGGRWSSKSYSVNTLAILLTFEKGQKILHSRFTASTAKDSIIEDIKQRINEMGLGESFKVTDKECTNLSTGNKIIFKGLKGQSNEDLDALKSISGITTWIIEEAQQLTDEKLFDTVNRSIRGNANNRNLRTIMLLNPTTVEHWIYKRFFEVYNVKAGWNGTKTIEREVPSAKGTKKISQEVTYVHTSVYDCVRADVWVDEDFLIEVEDLRVRNPERWNNEINGGWLERADGVIYSCWREGEFKEFSKPIIGIDWGFRHPTAIVIVSLDPDKMEAYVKCLYYRREVTYGDVIKFLHDNKYSNHLIVADNARPEGIAELRAANLNVYPTKKNTKGGSVADTIKLVQEYEIVVDDTQLTSQDYKPHPLQWELKNYVWEDRLTETPRKEYDDALDALRYAVSRAHTKRPTSIYI